MAKWLYLWALMESWLIAVDHVGRHAGSWRYIQGSTCNHDNVGKTNTLGWMLYSVCAVLSVNSWSWHGRNSEGWLNFVFCNDAWVVDEKERDGGWRWELCGGYERIWERRGTTCQIWLGRPRISLITRWNRACTCCIGDGQLTRTQISLKSQFLMMISPISSHLTLLSSILPSPENTKLSHRSLSLHAMIKR